MQLKSEMAATILDRVEEMLAAPRLPTAEVRRPRSDGR
jgi:hypothetical protein